MDPEMPKAEARPIYGQDAIRRLQETENTEFYALIDHPYMKQLAGRYYPQYREQWVKLFKKNGKLSDLYSAEGVTSLWAYLWPLWGLYHFIWWEPVSFVVMYLAAYAEAVINSTNWLAWVFLVSFWVFPKMSQATLFHTLESRCKKARSMSDAQAWRYVQRMTGGNFLAVLLGSMAMLAGLFYGMGFVDFLLIHLGYGDEIAALYAD